MAGPSEVEIEIEDIVEDRASIEELSGGDFDFDDATGTLLTLTGEQWTIDGQRESLKEAARSNDPPPRLPDPPSVKPAVAIPTPFDIGLSSTDEHVALVLEEEPSQTPRPPTRTIPPPLPTGAPASRSVPPPPLPKSPSRRPPTVEPPAPSKPPPGPTMKLPARPSGAPPPTAEPPRVVSEGRALIELLGARIERLATGDDRIGLARAHLELAIVQETFGDDGKVDAEVEAALKVWPQLSCAHAILRRRIHHSSRLGAMREHLEREIEAASSETTTVDAMAERARLLGASDRLDEAREAWETVLARVQHHAAALKGLEADLTRRTFTRADGTIELAPTKDETPWEDLVAHLGKMADAYTAQPDLAAWLHVERANLLEFRLGRVEAARGAFEKALRLDDGVGVVRDAFTLHCAAHHDTARLAALLSDEAQFESSPSRAARLELDAALLIDALGGDDAQKIALLERAAAHAPTSPDVDRRVLDELVRIYEAAGKWAEAARSRRARLRFFTDSATQVYELKRLATIEERLGNVNIAIHDVERAALVAPDDITLAPELDRLFAAAGDHSARIALWHDTAQNEEDGLKRARLLAKAARIADEAGRREEAIRHLRAAAVAAPGDAEIVDQLSRLISPPPVEHDIRGLIELYSQAASATTEVGRRIAYLEKVALLWEELAADSTRAARTFEEILRLEPGRRGAVLGLQRTAGRIGDDRALARALADEAKLVDVPAIALELQVRSAETLSRVDAARATSVVTEVLAQDPEHLGACVLETRLHEEAERWELAAESLKKRLSLVVTTKDKVAIWLHLAHIYDARLHDPKSAVEALQEARKADPVHPVPPDEIARVLAKAGDAKALRIAVERLAADAITPQERARHLLHAAEIDELRLGDDASAATLYARALAEVPDSDLAAERLTRVLARRVVTTAPAKGPAAFGTAAWQELVEHLGKRTTTATPKERAVGASLLLAFLLVAESKDLARARTLLDAAAGEDPAVLRLREAIARRGHSPQQIAATLKQQGEHFTAARAQLGALWELATFEAWKISNAESLATYTRILELDATDPSALAATVRLTIGPARREVPARRATISALRSLAGLAHDEGTRIATSLRLGLMLETHAMDPAADRETIFTASREALERLRETLALDPLSVTAATCLARIANRLGDTPGAVAAASSLAELAVQPKVRSRYLVDAANLLLSDAIDAALGSTSERAERAAGFLEKALAADANSKAAASRLAQVRAGQQKAERLVDVFRTALVTANVRDTVVFIGTELARVAQEELKDVSVAIEAMRAVRVAAADHVPSLLSLSELLIAQRAWPEAVEVLQDIVKRGREVPPRITALFALASIYEKVLAQPDDAERSLRTALGIQPENPRTIRALVHRLAAKQNETGGDKRSQANVAAKLEIASLLDRLTHVEKDRGVKCDVLLELADMRVALDDMPQAEKALIEAVAIAPDHARAFARLSRFFRSPAAAGAPAAFDIAAYARALEAVIKRGMDGGTSDARWYATLGRIEVDQLNRPREGVLHLQTAIKLDPTQHQCRFDLVSAFAQLGAHEEAIKAALAMLVPDATPLAALSDPNAALELYERELNAGRHAEEAIVVSELRAVAGALDEGRHAWLRGRRLTPLEQHHGTLDRPTLVSTAVPLEARHALLDIAGAVAGIEAKILRADLAELGISSRDRVSKRSGNPTRALLDRFAKALGLSDVELVIAPNATRLRVIAQDDPWVVVPKSMTELPEPTQAAALGRALARIALNVPWLEEIPAIHVEALLTAAARTVNPSFGSELDGMTLKVVAQYEPKIAREISRKQRQALERVLPSKAAPIEGGIEGFIHALARAELRIGYLLTGDVLATVDELRGLDPAFFKATNGASRNSLLAVLHHPFAGDVVRFALTPEATALRRRVGATWT